MSFLKLVTNKTLIVFIFFLLMLCDLAFSQSISFSDSQTTRFSIDRYAVHGLGVTPFSESSSDTTYTETCNSAMLDLSSSSFISVYLEIFEDAGSRYYEFPELAIKDSTEEFSLESFDSEIIFGNRSVHCLVKPANKSNLLAINIPDLNEVGLSPLKINGVWYSIGEANELINQKNKTWLMSKNDALKKLAKSLSTEIQSRQIQINGAINSFGYFRSRVIFRNVVVAKRMVIDSQYYSVIAINEDDITVF